MTDQQAAPQTGKTVIGYRELSNAEILAMNKLKQASRAFLAELEAVANTCQKRIAAGLPSPAPICKPLAWPRAVP